MSSIVEPINDEAINCSIFYVQ